MKSIVLAEDHAIIRDGLKLLIATRSNLRVAADTGDGNEVEQLVRTHAADLLLLDLDLPGCHGIEVTRSIKARHAGTRVLILTGNPSAASVNAAFEAGADGYVLKHENVEELLYAISLVLSGIVYLSKSLVHFSSAPAPQPEQVQSITAREQEILALIAGGNSSNDIAAALNLSVLTVRKHRQNLMAKLSLHNVADVTAYAMRRKLLPH
ncbi:response regulator transcription factor [Herbaspirillum sp. WKF16]|uniref:response regulator n=1 Tax=Herbaspirillum sp. WKF16 TaxID=3028312 RepID=UPI0023A9D4EB|nr:response regulator transcription factor [Herbaspirillum sp. WKF16]WDZ95798.1 response regulator transcription factor [Herbaspirillum sp. WKF16]